MDYSDDVCYTEFTKNQIERLKSLQRHRKLEQTNKQIAKLKAQQQNRKKMQKERLKAQIARLASLQQNRKNQLKNQTAKVKEKHQRIRFLQNESDNIIANMKLMKERVQSKKISRADYQVYRNHYMPKLDAVMAELRKLS